MPKLHQIFCLLLFCLPACLYAQEVTPDSFPRWYGSVQYGRQTYQIFSRPPYEPSLTNARRTQFSLGYQLNSNWAIQLGWGPANYKIDNNASGTNNAGQPYSEYRWSDNQSSTSSLVVRRCWKVGSGQRIQVEALGGAVLLNRHYKGGTIITDNGVVTENSTLDTRFTDWYAVVGPAVSYGFGRHFQATAELMLNKNLRGNTSYNTPVFKSFSLGVRYRFGYK